MMKGVKVFFMRANRFVRIGVLLHLAAAAGGALCFSAGRAAWAAWGLGQWDGVLIYVFLAAASAALLIFAQLDAFSRFQNYKKAKDMFYENGFKPRIADLFIHSRCQRDAVKVAARDLGFLDPLCLYYQTLGYRWFHLLPDALFLKPLVFFSRRYWLRTLFEKKYTSKYFPW